MKELSRLTSPFLAHSANGDGHGIVEPLATHLVHVGQRASAFANAFGAEQQGYAGGLLHDLGKYSEQFLRRLQPGSNECSRDHWSVGAMACAASYKRSELGAIPAMAIAAHHVGLEYLQHEDAICRALAKRFQDSAAFTETDSQALHERFHADGFTFPKLNDGLKLRGEAAADMLDVRMLFSALVDADFIETEAHFNGDAIEPRRYRDEGPELDIDRALKVLSQHIAALRDSSRSSAIQRIRDQLLAVCTDAGQTNPTGIFTLAAPTGAGKTLAMLAFALYHARQHGLRRIVLVMPFLNIIEQTAAIYRSLFSAHNGFPENTVIEHHSLADDSALDPQDERRDGVQAVARLLAENWDAPIVLTTSVQGLESLMAHRPSRCRKLHRLARSVILFDEVQTLPPKLAVATLATLSRLADPDGPFGATVLLATATQPAFDVLDNRVKQFSGRGWQPKEITRDASTMFGIAAERVQVSWRHTTPILLPELAEQLCEHRQVLCIVNLKRHAIDLTTTLRDRGVKGVLHLSTNMCPAHRTAVLTEVVRRLDRGRLLRLITTQCVEAGVDLDFPVVYRSLAPLEAIAQAAGRCNRHGRRDRGQTIVFKPIDECGLYPPGYQAAVQATESFLEMLARSGYHLDTTEIISNPIRLREYYAYFYGLSGRSVTELDDEKPVLGAIRAGSFEEAALAYRLIDDNTINVLVAYDDPTFDRLSAEIRDADPLKPAFIRNWIRRATPHAIAIYRPRDDLPFWNHLEPLQFSRRESDRRDTNWFIGMEGLKYDRTLIGLCDSENSWIA